MLKLYGGAKSRASIVRWYLEELGIPYEFVLMDLQAEEQHQPDFLKLNPMGKVPVIVDGDVVLWESGAILLYLAQVHDKLPKDAAAAAQVYQWVLFANSTLTQAMFPPENRDRQLPRLLKGIETALTGQSYILGNDFSVADVALGSVLAYLQMLFQVDLSPYPAVADYVARLQQRPAFQKGLLGAGA
ncbi:glutathione S-transferase family protein [Thermosynechococcus sichuanensis E542]|uniref:Glutathione S-transferase family protein n=1 Tax=Thermosynechococcus sichuanensis E542 TaxID=2016101 RepID=A0A3B7MCM8_9CYAN|nr:glutathione S-transferase family protein [Thermosynechococcus vestitus]AXY67151.1 glutathione S-transferase family protein [Thermosynechococcus vestitus E542]